MASQAFKTLSVIALASMLGACASSPNQASAPAKAEAAPAKVEAAAPAAPAQEAAPAAASASGLKLMPTPANTLAIHYFRKNKDWAPGDFAKCDFASCWGVHAWGDAYSADTSWFKPVFPVGTDDFGAVYHLKANEDQEIAKTAEANYILHKGDAKDQCAKDMSWDHTKSRDIFVVQDDCKVYLSVDEALKSPNYKK